MSVRTKSRRRITVDGEKYVWHIGKNAESGRHMLNIASLDKSMVLSVPLGLKRPYLISKGRSFGGEKTYGTWARYILPLDAPEIVTPAFVAAIIKAAVTENALERTDWQHIRQLNDNHWVFDIWGF